MAFVPPVFSKFGKVCVDLLDKKWEAEDFKNTISVKSASKGMTVTSKATQADTNVYTGKVTVDYKDKSFGKVTTEIETEKNFKGTLEVNSVYPGLVAKTTLKASSGKSIVPEASVEYVTEPVALAAAHNSKGQSASLAFGYEGFSCGGALTKSSDVTIPLSYEAGLQYEDGSMVGTAIVKKDYTVSLSLFHRVSSILQIAAGAVVASDAKKSTVSIGSQYELSSNCYVKGKVVIDGEKKPTAFGYVEHRISNPDAVVGVTGSYAPNTNDAKFGFSFSFGDK